MKKQPVCLMLLLALLFSVSLCATEQIVSLRMISWKMILDLAPLDDSRRDDSRDPKINPNSFRVTVSGTDLVVSKLDDSVMFADVVVVKSMTGEVVVEEIIMDEITQQIPESGNYTITIQTSDAALVGHFVVR